jgi:RNA polymerase sigma-70 factor (ECF subfamily)
MPETEMGGDGRAFTGTHWSVVAAAADPAAPGARAALDALVRAYWRPVYLYIRRTGRPIEDAKDLTQEFFATFLQRRLAAKADPARGRFRSFLLVSVRNFLHDTHDRERALKRAPPLAGVRDDEWLAEVPDAATPEAAFEREWAALVLARAMDALAAEYRGRGKDRELDAFRRYVEAMSADGAVSYGDLGVRTGLSETTLTNVLHRARLRYREAVLAVIREYVTTEDEARGELRELLGE